MITKLSYDKIKGFLELLLTRNKLPYIFLHNYIFWKIMLHLFLFALYVYKYSVIPRYFENLMNA